MPDESRSVRGTPRWKVLVADDEPLARLRLRTLLERHPDFVPEHECADGAEVLSVLADSDVDVAFLDVKMPQLDGVAVAELLAADARDGRRIPLLVFVTAYDAHAVRAFDLEAIDYLLKPVDVDRFDRALDRLRTWLSRSGAEDAGRDASDESTRVLHAALATLAQLRSTSRFPSRFPVRDRKGIYFVAAKDIERVEAEGNYVSLVAGGRKHLVRESMRGIEERLDPERFVRIHRSIIVNIDRIRRIEPWGHGEYVVTMADGAKVTSSRTNGERLQALMR